MLEKIIQEISEKALCNAADEDYFVMFDDVDEIIRSHMNEACLIAACHCKDCANKELIGKSGRVYCPIGGWKEPDDFCKRAKKGGKK